MRASAEGKILFFSFALAIAMGFDSFIGLVG